MAAEFAVYKFDMEARCGRRSGALETRLSLLAMAILGASILLLAPTVRRIASTSTTTIRSKRRVCTYSLSMTWNHGKLIAKQWGLKLVVILVLSTRVQLEWLML